MKKNAPHPEPLLLGIDETAELLSLPRRTLYGMISSGLLPRSFKLGKRRVFRRNDLTEWVRLGMPPLERFEILTGQKAG